MPKAILDDQCIPACESIEAWYSNFFGYGDTPWITMPVSQISTGEQGIEFTYDGPVGLMRSRSVQGANHSEWSNLIFVPEPGVTLGLLVGVLFLAALRRLTA